MPNIFEHALTVLYNWQLQAVNIVKSVMLDSNEPIKVVHIQKLANQSICNEYQYDMRCFMK